MRLLYSSCACLVLLSWVTSADELADSSSLRLDGGASWEEESWRVTVDGVMGGKSSGYLRFDDDGKTLVFTGEIDLDGGGFSSVRRRLSSAIDLSTYAGIVVEVESSNSDTGSNAPLGLHLQLHDESSYYGFAAAFVVPLVPDESDTTISTAYLSMSDFTRGGRSGWRCYRCVLNPSLINEIDVYVLFQEGPFEVRIKSITAVKEPQAFSSPVVPSLDGSDSTAISRVLQDTISAGGSLFDKSYVELCAAMYWSTLNTIVASSVDNENNAMKYVACSGLAQAMSKERSKSDIAWILRYTMNAMLADIKGENRDSYDKYNWLPKQGVLPENIDNEMCTGITSMLPSTYYNSESVSVSVQGMDTSAEGFLLSYSALSTQDDVSAALLVFPLKKLGIILSLVCLVCSL